MLFVIDESFKFEIDVIKYDEMTYADMNSLSIYTLPGPTIISYSEDYAMERIMSCMHPDFKNEFSARGKPLEIELGGVTYVHMDVLVYVMMQRFPRLIFKLIPFISSSLIPKSNAIRK